MEFSEDIYSLCFCSQASDEIMDPLFDPVKGRHLGHYEPDEDLEDEELLEREERKELDGNIITNMPKEGSADEGSDSDKEDNLKDEENPLIVGKLAINDDDEDY